MKVILFLSVFLVFLGLTLKRPFYGIVLFVALFYIAPAYQWWGWKVHFTFGIRTSFLAAIFLLIGYIIHRSSYVDQNRNVDKLPEVLLFIILCFGAIATLNAVKSTEVSVETTIDLLKFVLFYFLMSRVILSDKQMQIFIWLNLLGCFYFGWEAKFGDYMIGGRLEGLGGPGTAESEGLAAHVSIFVPYLGLYFFSGRKWEKIGVFMISPFILNTLILTRTRASFLSLLVMGIYFILFCDKKYRAKATLIITIGIIAFISLADPSFWTRIATIMTYNEEISASSRIIFWKAALTMMGDFPFGVGVGNFQLLLLDYVDFLEQPRAAHNTFLLVGAEFGFLALAVFLVFIFRVQRIFRKSRIRDSYSDDDNRRKIDMFGMEVGFIGFLVAAFFVNRLYVDSLFWMAAFAVAGEKIRRNHKVSVAAKNIKKGFTF